MKYLKNIFDIKILFIISLGFALIKAVDSCLIGKLDSKSSSFCE